MRQLDEAKMIEIVSRPSLPHARISIARESGGRELTSGVSIPGCLKGMRRNDNQRPTDRRAGLVAARGAFGAVGRIVLFHGRIAAGDAAAHDRVSARCARSNHVVAGVMDLRNTFS
jgi:hypothetical protein